MELFRIYFAYVLQQVGHSQECAASASGPRLELAQFFLNVLKTLRKPVKRREEPLRDIPKLNQVNAYGFKGIVNLRQNLG